MVGKTKVVIVLQKGVIVDLISNRSTEVVLYDKDLSKPGSPIEATKNSEYVTWLFKPKVRVTPHNMSIYMKRAKQAQESLEHAR